MLQKLSFTDWIIVALVGTITLIFAVILYSLLVPFKPLAVESLVTKPLYACPGELVSLDSRYTLEDGNYVIDVDPTWTNISTEEYLDEAYARFYVKTGEEPQQGTLVYQVPTEPGGWLYSADINVRGRVGILPRTQQLENVEADRATIIIDCGGPYTYEHFVND